MIRSRWFLVAVIIITGAGFGLYTMYQFPKSTSKARLTARNKEITIAKDGTNKGKADDFYNEQKDDGDSMTNRKDNNEIGEADFSKRLEHVSSNRSPGDEYYDDQENHYVSKSGKHDNTYYYGESEEGNLGDEDEEEDEEDSELEEEWRIIEQEKEKLMKLQEQLQEQENALKMSLLREQQQKADAIDKSEHERLKSKLAEHIERHSEQQRSLKERLERKDEQLAIEKEKHRSIQSDLETQIENFQKQFNEGENEFAQLQRQLSEGENKVADIQKRLDEEVMKHKKELDMMGRQLNAERERFRDSLEEEGDHREAEDLEQMKSDLERDKKEFENWKMSQQHEIDQLREEAKKERGLDDADQKREIEQEKAAIEIEKKELEQKKLDLEFKMKEAESKMKEATNSHKSRETIRGGADDVPQVDSTNFQGLDGEVIHEKYPGITFLSSYKKQEFLDAIGAQHKAVSSIDDVTAHDAEERFYGLVAQNHVQCKQMRRMGNMGDGGWDVCISAPYAPSEKDCLVYSFGINNDFTFDDAMERQYNCDVKAFDPSMNVGDHAHSAKVYFYQLGLGERNTVKTNGWKIETFGSILNKAGHSDRIIDVLKIDIEFDEWGSFRTMIREGSLARVKQFVFEIHTSEVYNINRPSTKQDFSDWYKVLADIEGAGFRRIYNHFNPFGKYISVRTGKQRTCCYELSYINLNFLKL